MRGVTQLGYLGFEVSDLEAWETFATDVLGLGVAARGDDGAFSLRMDDYRQRFFITGGEADDVSVIGWEVADKAALDEIAGRIESAGLPVTGGSTDEAAARNVTGLVKFTDPAGIPSELYYGPLPADGPFESSLVNTKFVAGDHGLGHCVVTSNDKKASTDFYTNVLGFVVSDHIVCEIYGFPVDLTFFHVNGRHHTVALGGPQKKRIHHFMLEVGSFDDVGLGFDRALKNGTRIAQTLGRHPNDRMFSFYAHTPSGFQFEYGWGGRIVDDATWEPTTYDCVSEWGHHPPQVLAPRRKK
jgi:2,3-dihydroxybiphenyl 1,2-dioxygenase